MKFTLEISKNILPIASIFTLAVILVLFGIITDSVPSLGVFDARVIGHVLPPSVDNSMFTAEQFTGDASVFAEFQVIDWVERAAQETFVFGFVIANGPAVFVTLNVREL